jgi:hypothetical protein
MKHTRIDDCRILVCPECDREQYELSYCDTCLRYENNPECKCSPRTLVKSKR